MFFTIWKCQYLCYLRVKRQGQDSIILLISAKEQKKHSRYFKVFGNAEILPLRNPRWKRCSKCMSFPLAIADLLAKYGRIVGESAFRSVTQVKTSANRNSKIVRRSLSNDGDFDFFIFMGWGIPTSIICQ